MPTATNKQIISAMYVAVFNRAPDAGGLAFWETAFAANSADAVKDLAAGFTSHPAFSETYGAMDDLTFVRAIYQNVLGGPGDAGGVVFWHAQISNGVSRSDMLASFVDSSLTVDLAAAKASGALTDAEFTAATARQDQLTNKANVGLQFAAILGANSDLDPATDATTVAGLNADPAFLASVAAIRSVTNDDQTALDAITLLNTAAADADPIAYVNTNAAPAAGVVGTTFVLTTGIDNFTGTSGNDTFIGDNSGGTVTVTAGDQVNGGAGIDTFNYFGAADAVVLPQMNGIEVLNLFNPAVTTALNTSAVSGLEQVNYVNAAFGANNLAGITLAATQQLGFNNVTQAATNTVTAAFGTTATAATLNLSNGSEIGTVNLDGTAIKTLNVNSTGSKANTIAGLASDGAEEILNVSGNQKATITVALADTVKTVDASAMTAGGVVVTAGNADVKFTGGAGDDTITFTGTEFDSKDVVDGGAGKDTVIINDAAAADAATNAEILKGINAFQNVEVLGFGTALAENLDLASVTSVKEFLVANAGENKFISAETTDSFTVNTGGGAVAGLTVANKVGEQAATVKLANQVEGADAADAADSTLTTLIVAQASTINVESTGKAANVIDTLTIGDNRTVVITGDKDLSINNAVAATATGHKIDASGFGGKLAVEGSGQNDIIIGSAQNDTFTASEGKDTYTLGAGNDTVIYSDVTQSGVTIATADTITDWATGTNKIDIKGGNFAIDAGGFNAQATVQAAVNAAADGFDAKLAAAASVIGTDQVGAFQFGDNTYVFVNKTNEAVAATEGIVVELTGQHTITADAFVFA